MTIKYSSRVSNLLSGKSSIEDIYIHIKNKIDYENSKSIVNKEIKVIRSMVDYELKKELPNIKSFITGFKDLLEDFNNNPADYYFIPPPLFVYLFRQTTNYNLNSVIYNKNQRQPITITYLAKFFINNQTLYFNKFKTKNKLEYIPGIDGKKFTIDEQKFKKFLTYYFVKITNFFKITNPFITFRGEGTNIGKYKTGEIPTEIKLFNDMITATTTSYGVVNDYIPYNVYHEEEDEEEQPNCCLYGFNLPKDYCILPLYIFIYFFENVNNNTIFLEYIDPKKEGNPENLRYPSFIHEIDLIPDIYLFEKTKNIDFRKKFVSGKIKYIQLIPITDKTNLKKVGKKFYIDKNYFDENVTEIEHTSQTQKVFESNVKLTFVQTCPYQDKNKCYKLYHQSESESYDITFETRTIFIKENDFINVSIDFFTSINKDDKVVDKCDFDIIKNHLNDESFFVNLFFYEPLYFIRQENLPFVYNQSKNNFIKFDNSTELRDCDIIYFEDNVDFNKVEYDNYRDNFSKIAEKELGNIKCIGGRYKLYLKTPDPEDIRKFLDEGKVFFYSDQEYQFKDNSYAKGVIKNIGIKKCTLLRYRTCMSLHTEGLEPYEKNMLGYFEIL